MKINRLILLSFTLFLFSTVTIAQSDNNAKIHKTKNKSIKEKEDSVFNYVEKMPEFPGGSDELMKYLMRNIKYPEAAKEEGVSCKTIVAYIIDKDGTVTKPKIIRGCSRSLEKEIIEVIKRMPKWIPGEHNGKKVRVQMNIPIHFHLDN